MSRWSRPPAFVPFLVNDFLSWTDVAFLSHVNHAWKAHPSGSPLSIRVGAERFSVISSVASVASRMVELQLHMLNVPDVTQLSQGAWSALERLRLYRESPSGDVAFRLNAPKLRDVQLHCVGINCGSLPFVLHFTATEFCWQGCDFPNLRTLRLRGIADGGLKTVVDMTSLRELLVTGGVR